eukprot:2734480-Alexandrium_andersonii.AAC.1
MQLSCSLILKATQVMNAMKSGRPETLAGAPRWDDQAGQGVPATCSVAASHLHERPCTTQGAA